MTGGGGGTADCDDATAYGGTANGDAAGIVAAAIRTACAEAAVRQVRYLCTYPHYYTYYTALFTYPSCNSTTVPTRAATLGPSGWCCSGWVAGTYPLVILLLFLLLLLLLL